MGGCLRHVNMRFNILSSGLIALCFLAGLTRAQHEPNCAENRVAMVHLFEWKWNDIADECERFLAPRGYCGVQVSPPTDHIMSGLDGNEPLRSWWERYQPISYKLNSRSGNRAEFVDMVERCNNVGVRIYVDTVINHMCGVGRKGTGIGGGEYDADDNGHFPDVPYTLSNFNGCETCPACCCINQWTDHDMVRNCRLLGLIDLNPKVKDTEDKIVGYLNDVIDIGVAGFRVDAAKHMWPEDLHNIYIRLNNLNTRWFSAGARPFWGMEVIDYNQHGEVNVHMYKHLGRVTEMRFCSKVTEAVEYLPNIEGIYNPGWGMVDSEDAFIFVDNHDNQRGHGGGGHVITHKEPREYKMAQAIALGYDYGHPRVMSSYFFDDSEAGPPHYPDYTTADVIINEDGSCGGGWVCEHRWTPVAGMAGFAKAAKDQPYINRHREGNEMAWSRGDRAFIAMTNHGGMGMTLYTGLPGGTYCDVITGCATESGCTGKSVQVDGGGNAYVEITNGNEPMLAIHVEALSGSGSCEGESGGPAPTAPPVTTAIPPPSTTRDPSGDWRRTVVYMYSVTSPGQDLFFRGGIDHGRRPGCTEMAETSECAVSISHVSLGTGEHYEKINAWRVGDNHLDWYGAEMFQGTWSTRSADGTPAVWTSNEMGSPGYQDDNRWGEHYWKAEFDMDCTEAEDGWFEVKAYVAMGAGWEADISQGTCQGTAGGSAPYSTNNHMARCGYLNRFDFDSGSCFIDNL